MARTGRPRSSGSRLDLDEPLRSEFDDFLMAHHTASSKDVVHQAIRAFINADLQRNAGVREEYENLQRARRDRIGNGNNLRIIKTDKPP
jgi:hypothetical protein